MEYRITGREKLYPILREMRKFDMQEGEAYRVNIFEIFVFGENDSTEAVEFAGIQPLDVVIKLPKIGTCDRSNGFLPDDLLVKGEIAPGLINLFNAKLEINEKQIVIEKDWRSRVLYL